MQCGGYYLKTLHCMQQRVYCPIWKTCYWCYAIWWEVKIWRLNTPSHHNEYKKRRQISWAIRQPPDGQPDQKLVGHMASTHNKILCCVVCSLHSLEPDNQPAMHHKLCSCEPARIIRFWQESMATLLARIFEWVHGSGDPTYATHSVGVLCILKWPFTNYMLNGKVRQSEPLTYMQRGSALLPAFLSFLTSLPSMPDSWEVLIVPKTFPSEH